MKRGILINLLLTFSMYVTAQQQSVYTDVDADFKKGIELLLQEKYSSAKEQFETSITRIQKGDETANHQLLINSLYYNAFCSKQLNRPDAEQLFIDLVNDYETNPTTRRAYFQLADIYFQNKKYDKSLTWLKKVDVNDLSADELLQYKFESGVSYFFKKDFVKAKPFFAELKNEKGDYYFPSNYYYGYVAYKQNDLKSATTAFKIVGQSELYSNVVPYYMANINFMQHNYDLAIADALTIVSTATPYKAELNQLLGKSYFEKGQYEKALPYFAAYESGTSKISKEDYYQIGVCQYKAKQYEDAIISLKQLTSLNDSIGQNALYLLGDCYLQTGKKNDARLAFDYASQMNEDLFIKEQSSFQYAKLSHELNYRDVAIKSLQKFIQGFPKSVYVEEAKKYLSKEFVSTNNYRDALEIIRTISSKSSDVRRAYQKVSFGRATELFNEKNFTEADQLLDESLKNPIDAGLQAAAYFWKGEAAYNMKKYDAAILNHEHFLDLNSNKISLPANVSATNSQYTLGYCYLKNESYEKANSSFLKVRKSLAGATDAQEKKIFSDAALRKGDCEFILKNYSSAANDYALVIDKKFIGSDYALYQTAMIQGLQNKTTDKISSLSRIVSEFPSSIYLDDAYYELGVAYLTVPAYQDAAQAFKQITTKFSAGSYAVRSHLKLGLIYFNLNNNEKAIEEYKWVISRYPKTAEGKEALNGVREIYTDAGDAQGYLNFVSSMPDVNVSDAVKDSVVYLAAELKYSKGDCDKAIPEFGNYLLSFPKGTFVVFAHFYRGECLFRKNDFDEALNDYEFVADQPQNRFSEKAILQAARINYVEKKNYSKAYEYYQRVSTSAELRSSALEAAKGMMYSAYYLNQFENASKAANTILSLSNSGTDDLLEAHFYLAKSSFALKDFDNAFAEFSIVSKSTTSVIGAESGYRMAEIYFKKNDQKKSEEQAWNVIKQKPNNNYWIAKSYLLLADIYQAQQDFFQSKSTLQSIIDNYKGSDEILATAKQKLVEVKAKEATQSKLLPDVTEPVDSFIIDK
ncbi:MAG: tetratricopeptide repeat protein [Chitinophagales bacterium]|nr:tetratricopeptide repeat protein [Chitinophagales bacterium]